MPPIVPAPSRSSAFGVDVLTLVTGTTLAMFITILASPIITRLYGPEAFGLVALFVSIIGIFSSIACFRYECAIMLPQSDKEAANVLGLCMILVAFFSILSVPVLILLQQPLVQFLKAPQLSPFFWLMPIVIFISGTFAALNYWNTRTKNFHRLSIARVTSSSSATGTQLGMGFLGHASGGVLIYANILAQIVSTFMLGIQILRDHLCFFKQNISWNEMGEVSRRYSNFPKYEIFSTLLNMISWQTPVFFLSYFFSTTIVGYYSLGMMMIQMPMSLIGGAIAQVFFQRASEARLEGTLQPLVENITHVLVKIGIFPMMVLLIVGKDLFVVVFGNQWADAGLYVQILSVWASVWFITSPLNFLTAVLQKQSWDLKIYLGIFSTRIISLIVGGLLGNVVLTLILFSLSGFIVYGYLCLKLLEFSNVSKNVIIKIIESTGILIFPAGILLFSLELLNVNPLVVVCFAILVGLIYYLYLLKYDPLVKDLFNGSIDFSR
jgi:lipopolysaccharide exporter